MTDIGLCPCNSNKPYSTCCEPLLAKDKNAATAEALMRSRYTAYVERDTNYLLKTWHPSTRPANIDPATIPEWYGLHIVNTEAGSETDSKGVVEFKATSIEKKIMETSRGKPFCERRWSMVLC